MSLEEFQRQRRRLFGIAYRMLGSASDAEDVLQDAYLRWHGADTAVIEEPAAWLAKVVTNLSINRLTSARARHEQYVGPWLPEPVLTSGGALGPMDTAEQRESVSLAMLALLERLTPGERAVFVLREAFGYSHREIAGLTGNSEVNCRQLHRRARQRVQDRPRFTADPRRANELLDRFLAAAGRGAIGELEQLLAADVVSTADGGGKSSAARRPIFGRAKVARYLAAIFDVGQTARFHGMDATVPLDIQLVRAEVNGEPAALGLADGRLLGLFAATESDGRLVAFHGAVNPAKLGFITRQLQELSRPAVPPGQ